NRLKRLNERKLQIQECKVQEVKGSDASSGDTDSSGIVSDKGDDQCLENQSNTSRNESSRSRNECNGKGTSGDDTDIRPSYDTEPIDEVPYTVEYNVFAVETQHSEQPENINDTSLMEKVDSHTTPDSSDMCNNEFKDDQNDDHEDERVVFANLIANLKLDIFENKKIQKQLRNANTELTHELKECKSTLEKTNRTLGESNRTRDRYLGALHDKEVELSKLAPKGSTYNGRPTFVNPMYLKKAQSKKPCMYEIPYDKSDLANIFAPDREETLTLEQDSRSKLNKDLVKPYDYTKQNSLYENFKPPSWEYLDQFAHANEV
ncbi:hypothetical protein Tco_0714149, partial [Tanacetum coccineum]